MIHGLSWRPERVHTAGMSRTTHYVLVRGQADGADGAADEAESQIPDDGPNHDSVWRIAAFRPDGSVVVFENDYERETLDELVTSMREEIAIGAALSLPKLTKRSDASDLRVAARRLLVRAAALETLEYCKSPDRFDPWRYQHNPWRWGQFGVTHLTPGHDSDEVWLVVIGFHA